MNFHDLVGLTITGDAYPSPGNPHPHRFVNATVVQVTGEGENAAVYVNINDDDIEGDFTLRPVFDEGPLVGHGTDDYLGAEWDLDFEV